MIASDRFEQVEIASIEALRAWLAANHARTEGVWLVTWKKAVPAKYVPRAAVLDELTAAGWTDGLMRRIDGERVMQLVSPRREDRWAQTDKDRAARLTAAGRMLPAGLAAIARSQRAGKWETMAAVDALAVPADLAAALNAASALAPWHDLPPSYRRNVLRWIDRAATAATRARRIGEAATATATGTRLPQM